MTQQLRAIFREMILDFQEREIPPSTKRSLRFEVLPGKAMVCIGVRRCGKSTLMLQQAQALIEEGVRRECLVYLNLFDDRLHGLSAATLGLVLEEYYKKSIIRFTLT